MTHNDTVLAIRALRLLRDMLSESGSHEIQGDKFYKELWQQMQDNRQTRGSSVQPTGLLTMQVFIPLKMLARAGLIRTRHEGEDEPMPGERFEKLIDSRGIRSFWFSIPPNITDIYRALGISSLRELEKRAMGDSVSMTPVFRAPRQEATQILQRNIFVLMPFAVDMKPVFNVAIGGAARRLGLTVARADDFFTGSAIMTTVWEAMWAADIVIADCTGRNPNVFYELGMAHTIGKKTVIIAQDIEDIPFDIRQFPHILYEYSKTGLHTLSEELEKAISQLTGLNQTAADAFLPDV